MKKFVITLFLALGVISAFGGCERNDYQHPLHRSR